MGLSFEIGFEGYCERVRERSEKGTGPLRMTGNRRNKSNQTLRRKKALLKKTNLYFFNNN